MKLIDSSDVRNDSGKSVKRRYLETDMICIKCGIIFNGYYEDDCVICYEDKERDEKCNHDEFVTGDKVVYLRYLLDMHIDELCIVNAMCGYSNSNKNRMTINIMKNTYHKLDKKINEDLVKKITYRNKRRFWYVKDVKREVLKRSASLNLSIIDKNECIDDKDLIHMKIKK